jgi:hypothetical protein
MWPLSRFARSGILAAALVGLMFVLPAPTANAQTTAGPVAGICMTYDEFGVPYFLPCPQGNTPAIDKIAEDRIGNLVQQNQLARILLGSYEQINCTNTCVSAFGAIGSFSAGFHGRKYLTPRLSLLGGLSINNFGSGNVTTKQALIAALGVRYDLVEWGSSRPFFEAGGSIAPTGRSRSIRTYTVGGTLFWVASTTSSKSYMAYIRAGWVQRVTPRDEFSVFADLSRQWQVSGTVRELVSAANPFPATMLGGTDMMNVARLTVQHVHLVNKRVEVQANATLAHSFNVKSGVKVNIPPLGLFSPAMGSRTWLEYGARIGFRVNPKVTIDTFVVGASGPRPIGNSIHGGVGVRAVF